VLPGIPQFFASKMKLIVKHFLEVNQVKTLQNPFKTLIYA
jgi:hypothetical protein